MIVALREIAPGVARSGIAERLWVASRTEFSRCGYHGARVQSIARRAGCNVALLYRHWSSKKALYLEVLRSVWESPWGALANLSGRGSVQDVVKTCVDVMLADPPGAQILVREILDGAPFLGQIVAVEPRAAAPLGAAMEAFSSGRMLPLREGLHPGVAVLVVCGLSALVASAHDSGPIFFTEPPPQEVWRKNLVEMLLHGLLSAEPVGAAIQVAPIQAVPEDPEV